MRQLVGLKCARCEKTIPSIIDGHYCAECGCPVHNRCAVPDLEKLDTCPMCGSAHQAVQANLQAERADAVEYERDLRTSRAVRHLGIGSACLVAGCIAPLFFGVLGLALVAIGLAEILHGTIILLRKGPPQN